MASLSTTYTLNVNYPTNRAALSQNLHDDGVNNLILVGNPGSGKSTILNALMGEVRFKSGFSVSGLTQVLQIEKFMNVNYIDTPGLEDIARKKQAGVEIEKALKKDGTMKLVFVVTLEGGRIRSADIATIETVLGAFKPEFKRHIQYGIIVNKMQLEWMEEDRQITIVKAFSDILTPANKIHFMRFDDRLNHENIVVDLPPDTIKFISTVKNMNPPPGVILHIITTEFNEKVDQMTKDLMAATNKINQLQAQLETMSNKSSVKATRFRVRKGRKVHRWSCRFIKDSDYVPTEVSEYSDGDQCILCLDG